ncbi:ferredoxin reductase [Iamia sp. SCSIO 61187]|nr:ferredoxin reductase [Iamia sp. SCSIO 61187]
MATAPHGVDRFLELVRPTWAADDTRARVVAATRETPDVVTLTLRPGRGWARGRAGQHVRLGVEIDGRRHTRCFSLASSEHRTDGLVEVTVKANPDGIVSRHLVATAAPGLVVALGAPEGDFTLPATRPDRLVLVSGGSGITPVMALLRTLVDEGHDRPITFLHYARTPADVIYADELAALGRTHPQLDVHVVTTRGAGTGALTGRFCAAHLEAVVPDLGGAEAYACGPVGLVDAALAHWEQAGAIDRLHVERYSLVAAPSDGAGERASGEGSTGARTHFAGSDVTVTSVGTTLLEQAEAAGLTPAFGCRVGICRTCTRTKVSGRVRDVRSGTVSGSGEEPIQLCVSAPCHDVVVDL